MLNQCPVLMHCQNKNVLGWGSTSGQEGQKKGACWEGGNKSFAIPGTGAATLHSSMHIGTLGCCGLQNLLSVSPSWTRRMQSRTLMRMAGTSTMSCTCLCELQPALPALGIGCSHLLVPSWTSRRLATSRAILPGPMNGCSIALQEAAPAPAVPSLTQQRLLVSLLSDLRG